jgi:hypothetical protein
MTRLELLRRRLGFTTKNTVRPTPVETWSVCAKRDDSTGSAVRTEEGICIHE